MIELPAANLRNKNKIEEKNTTARQRFSKEEKKMSIHRIRKHEHRTTWESQISWLTAVTMNTYL